MDKLDNEIQRLPERFPKSGHIELGSDGWLSPKGDFYKVGTTEHNESAEYIYKNSGEVKSLEEKLVSNRGKSAHYEERPYREKLKQFGFILVRGEVLRAEDSINYTPAQLRAISRAGIRIVSALDGSIEYDPDKLLEKTREIIGNLQNDQIVGYIQSDRDGHKGLPWFRKIRTRTLDDIKKFSQDPLNTVIHIDESAEPATEDIVSSRILDILSPGYIDEMRITLGRSEYTFRIVGLNGVKLLIQWEKYTHDLLSGFLHINNYISMIVVDDRFLKDKLTELVERRSKLYRKSPEITLANQEGYFAGVIVDLVSQR